MVADDVRGRIVVADDDPKSRDLMAKILRADGHTVTPVADGQDAISLATHEPESIDLVVSDVRMAESDGFQVLAAFRDRLPDAPVILVTAFGNVDGAVDAIRKGAFDYISKPYDVDQIRLVVSRALRQRQLAQENKKLRHEARDKYQLANIVGRSETMLQVFKTAARVASTNATVLIQGESGTGKELVARAIHLSSPREKGPFVAVDCGAIAEGVLESELFGHAKGAFTGAQVARRGLFEEADGGTLFLDEIGDVGARVQAQLLRALQEGEIRRVGTNEAVHVNVRVVAASNKDLAQAVHEAKFREDLYYRLNVVTLRLPPLRDRMEDIALLAEHFMAKHSHGSSAALSPEALEVLQGHRWPGNVRELENAIARALALNPSGMIMPEDFTEAIRQRPVAPTTVIPSDRPTLGELERRYADVVLKEANGNKTRAAEILGIDRKTLYRILGVEKE